MRKQWRFGQWIDSLLLNGQRSYAMSSNGLGLFRIVYGVHALFTGAIPVLLHMSDSFPNSFYTPPLGSALFFSGFPPYSISLTLLICTIAFCVMMTIGIHTRLSSLGFAATSIIGYSIVFSFGKINHNTLYYFLPLFLAFSSWGDAYSYDSIRNSEQRAKKNTSTRQQSEPKSTLHYIKSDNTVLLLYALTNGWMFMTAALPKIIGGWLDPHTHAVYGWIVQTVMVDELNPLLAKAIIPFTHSVFSDIFWETADILIILFEALFLWAALHKKNMIVFCSFAIIFHLFVLLFLSIDSSGFLPCYLVFLDWDALSSHRIIQRIQQIFTTRQYSTRFIKTLCIIVAATATIVITYITANYGSGVEILQRICAPTNPLYVWTYPVEICAAAIAAVFLIRKLYVLTQRKKLVL